MNTGACSELAVNKCIFSIKLLLSYLNKIYCNDKSTKFNYEPPYTVDGSSNMLYSKGKITLTAQKITSVECCVEVVLSLVF